MKIAKHIVVSFVLIIVACKKTKLEGEMSVFVGTWEWKYTILDDNVCSPIPAPVITHTPEQDGFTYRLEIERKGKLRIFVNGKKDKCYRLVKRDFADHSSDTTFSFSLNNKKGSGVYFTYKKRNNIKYLESAYFPQNVLRGVWHYTIDFKKNESIGLTYYATYDTLSLGKFPYYTGDNDDFNYRNFFIRE